MRVATSTMNSVLLAQSMRAQADHSQALTQQGSGLKSEKLSGLGGAAGHTISLESDLKISTHLVSSAQTAESMVEVSYGAVSGILDLIETAKVDIAAALNGTVTSTDGLKANAETWLVDTADGLNTDFGGAYIFAGAGGSAPPVDLNDPAYDPLSSPGTPDAGYYQGHDADRAIMVGGGSGLSYGVGADADGFEETLRAFSILTGMTTSPPDTVALQAAYDLLDSAAADLGDVQENLSGQSASLSALIDRETAFQLFVESALESVRSVDLAEAAAKAAELEVVLEASYSALATILSVSLSDYLR